MQVVVSAVLSATLLIPTPAYGARLAQYVRIFDAQTTDTTNYINLQQVHVFGECTLSDC
jgi:hypothetical protein